MSWIDLIARALSEGPGFVVLPDFLPANDLARDFESKQAAFYQARVGRGDERAERDEIRRDRILWFEPDQLTPAQEKLWSRLEELRLGLNERLFLGLWDLEGHYAFYPPGGFYRRHIDRFASSSARTVSIVFYLNQDWKQGDGGELLIYAGETDIATIEPRAGTLVCFLSEKIEHEVSPAKMDRRSFSGWFRQRA